MAVFLLIGKTSALTMNVAGVVKDWILILLSYLIYKAPGACGAQPPRLRCVAQGCGHMHAAVALRTRFAAGVLRETRLFSTMSHSSVSRSVLILSPPQSPP